VAEQPLQDDVDEEGEELALALLPPAPLGDKTTAGEKSGQILAATGRT